MISGRYLQVQGPAGIFLKNEIEKRNDSMDSGIKNVVFDIGEVLVKFNWKEYLHSFGFPEETEEDLGRIIFTSSVWDERDRGLFTEEEYIKAFKIMAASVNKNYDAEIDKVFEHIEDCIYTFDFTEEWLKNVKAQGYNIYLLTNFCRRNYAVNVRNQGFYRYVDGEVVSCEEHMMKPEPFIYLRLLSRYELRPMETVFIDDRPVNIATASYLGLHTILATDHETVTKELLRRFNIKS